MDVFLVDGQNFPDTLLIITSIPIKKINNQFAGLSRMQNWKLSKPIPVNELKFDSQQLLNAAIGVDYCLQVCEGETSGIEIIAEIKTDRKCR